jgi:signal transduction histidine kinase
MPTIHTLPAVAHLWFSLLVIAVLEGIAIYTWHFRKESGAFSLIGIQICKAGWLMGLLMACLCTEPKTTLLWVSLFKTSGTLSCLFWFRFVTQLSGFDRELPARMLYAIHGAAGLLCALFLTNRWNEWFWRLDWQPQGTDRILEGPAHILYVLTGFPLYFLALGICVRWALRSKGLRRRQAILILSAALLSWTGQLLASMPAFNIWMSLSSCLLLSSMITAWTYHRWRIFSITPLAQQILIEKMIDGLMVVDEAGYIVELNPTACALFHEPCVMKGCKFENALQTWPELAGLGDQKGVAILEANREVDGSRCFYRITLTSLHTPAGYPLGRILVFKDITNEKQQQARIVEQERTLAMMDERDRLGRELHDGQGQVWSYILLTAQMLRVMLAKRKYEQADQELVRLVQVVQEMHTGFRESVHGLHVMISAGLLHALESQLEWYRKYCGLDVQLILHCTWRQGMLRPAAEAHLLRIVQEAMVNIRKSAKARHVEVILDRLDENLQVRVKDDGCGFDVEEMRQKVGHRGLEIMHERAQEIGGRLHVDSRPGLGTEIQLTIPLAGEGWENILR